MNTIFTINPRKAGIFLGIIAVVMSVLAITGDILLLKYDNTYLWPTLRQFNFVEEGNIANFYQGLQLVIAGVLLLIVWRGKVQRKEPHRTHWLVLGCIFLFLGTDEVAQIHETTIANTIAAFRHHESDKTGWFWVYLPLLAVFGLSYIPFLKRLPGRIAVLFMVAGMIYVGGAVGVEKFVNHFAKTHGDDNVAYVLLDNLGEFMESTGIALFVYAILSYLAHEGHEIAFRLKNAEPSAK